MRVGSTRDKLKRAVRKTVKWGGAGLTVLLVVVWIGSGWFSLTRGAMSGMTTTVGNGCFVRFPFFAPDLTDEPFWKWSKKDSFSLESRFMWNRLGRSYHVQLPLWPLPLLSLLATAAAWRVDLKYLRRAREGACPACGCDRAGLAAGAVCPECGAAPSV